MLATPKKLFSPILKSSFILLIALFLLRNYQPSNHMHSISSTQKERKFFILSNQTENVCYINCLIQSLFSFRDYFFEYEGYMSSAINEIYNKIENTRNFSHDFLISYKRILRHLNMPRFNVLKPGDSMELIHFILNHIIFHYFSKKKIKVYDDFYVHKRQMDSLLGIPVVKDFCCVVSFLNNDYLWFNPVILLRFSDALIQNMVDDFFNVKDSSVTFINLPNVLILSFWKKLGAANKIDFLKEKSFFLAGKEYGLNSLVIYVKRKVGGHYFSLSLVKDSWYLFDEDKIVKIEMENFNVGFVALAFYKKIE